jgi:F0F1-type ATP synthase membrane subunit a
VRRAEYLRVLFPTTLLSALVPMVIIKSENQLPESVKAVMAIVALCLAIVIFVKSTIARLKNLGMSAHFLLFFFVPFANFWLLAVLMFREGAPESLE